MRHTKFVWQGERVDCGSEWGISAVDEIVKIAGYLSFESIHHYLHLLLHRLHLREDRGGVASTRDGMLMFRRFSRLGALLPSGPSRSRCLALESPRSSAILLSAFRCSCSSKTWFCLVRRSTAAVRTCTCFSKAVGCGSSSRILLMVAINQVSTMQLFCRGSVSCGL